MKGLETFQVTPTSTETAISVEGQTHAGFRIPWLNPIYWCVQDFSFWQVPTSESPGPLASDPAAHSAFSLQVRECQKQTKSLGSLQN